MKPAEARLVFYIDSIPFNKDRPTLCKSIIVHTVWDMMADQFGYGFNYTLNSSYTWLISRPVPKVIKS